MTHFTLQQGQHRRDDPELPTAVQRRAAADLPLAWHGALRASPGYPADTR